MAGTRSGETIWDDFVTVIDRYTSLMGIPRWGMKKPGCLRLQIYKPQRSALSQALSTRCDHDSAYDTT